MRELPSYKTFPKADPRRYFVALLALDRLKDRATVHYVAQEIGCTRAEAQRALQAATIQFGVQYAREESKYEIISWGVLNKAVVANFVMTKE